MITQSAIRDEIGNSNVFSDQATDCNSGECARSIACPLSSERFLPLRAIRRSPVEMIVYHNLLRVCAHGSLQHAFPWYFQMNSDGPSGWRICFAIVPPACSASAGEFSILVGSGPRTEPTERRASAGSSDEAQLSCVVRFSAIA